MTLAAKAVTVIPLLLVAKQPRFFSRLTFFEDPLCLPSLASHPDSVPFSLPAGTRVSPADGKGSSVSSVSTLPRLPSELALRPLSLEVA